ncbi:MAG: hypothetical protein GY925_26425 [Actinomycetia bacterium]|nr:hypothetical protein [Actinomycetes bacterium]
MAAHTLPLDAWDEVTLSATAGDRREVIFPVGARYWEAVSLSATTGGRFWIEESGTDESTRTSDYGSYDVDIAHDHRFPGSGGGRSCIMAAVSLYISGEVVSQLVQIRATSDSP